MPQIGIIRTAWSGTSGGPGLTQTAFRDLGDGADITNTQAQAAVNAMRAYWNSLAGLIPNEVTLTVQPIVDVYDIISGALVASQTVTTPPAAVVGTDTGNYSMASGIKANLNTSVIRAGRRVRGAMYIVPAGASAYSATGAIAGTAKTTVNTAGGTLKTAFTTGDIELLVWSRPATTTSNDGDVAPVSTVEANEKSAILRGRRD